MDSDYSENELSKRSVQELEITPEQKKALDEGIKLISEIDLEKTELAKDARFTKSLKIGAIVVKGLLISLIITRIVLEIIN